MGATQRASTPAERVIGYQRWTDLLFVHWRAPPERVAPLLPPGLELDLWDGDAWIGLVPFHMSGVRPWWFSAVPGVSEFHETNLRTYATLDGQPGVWFFSLEASNKIAVAVARSRWNLNYHHARMALERDGDRILYRSQRTAHSAPPVGMEAVARVSSAAPAEAMPGTLEYFLIERYTLYCAAPRGALFAGRVHHPPYRFVPAKLERCHENLLATAGVVADGGHCHVMYSAGVSVAISPLTRVAPRCA